MRKTTKMFAAQAVRKRDGRGRFTGEQGGGVMNGGYAAGGYSNDGGNMQRHDDGNVQMRRGDYSARMNEPRSYGDNRRGGTRNDGAYGGGNEYRMNGGDRIRYGNPAPNYNYPEGRDIEHDGRRPGNRTYDMGYDADDDETRIGFRTRPEVNNVVEPYNMGGGHTHGNVVSMQRGSSHGNQHEHKPEEFTEETAEKWVKSMKNEDGTKGPHWTREQAKQVMQHMGIQNAKPHEFYAVINSLYSDFCGVAKKFSVDGPEFFGEMAKAWLDDRDAVEDKAAAYYCYVVEHKMN